MRKKRILSWILCAAILLSLIPAGVFAAGEEYETAEWLNTAGNELYLGGIKVTAENAADIIGSYTGTGITGTAYFQVENGIPTLYLDNVTVKDGYKESDFRGGTIGYLYEVYGIYYKPAGCDELKIKLSGTNVIEPEGYTDERHKSSWTYGIMVEKDCTELLLEGGEDTKLNVISEYQALSVNNNNDGTRSCLLCISGGEYGFKTTGTKTSGEGIYNLGSLKVENSKINIVSESDRGIWVKNRGAANSITSIENSDITIKAGIGENLWDGILSENDVEIKNSSMNIECDGVGISVFDGKSITISGEDTVVEINSVGEVRKNWDDQYAAILTENIDHSEGELPQTGEIILNDGLAVTTPDAGRVSGYDFYNLIPRDTSYADCRTVIDQYGAYARNVVIKTPTVHCVCGGTDCSLHSNAVTHTAENSLNLISDIKNGAALTSGSYYLSDDLKILDENVSEDPDKTAYNQELLISGNVNICLNGHNLDANIIPDENAVLNICDCKDSGTITNSGGHVIAFRNDGATVNIYGGTLESTCEANTIIDFENHKGNELNLYGGTVNYGSSDKCTAIGSRTLIVNLYGGRVTAKSANGIVVLNGKLNLCGNTKISVSAGYDSIKVYGKRLIDAKGYTGDAVSILCGRLSNGEPCLSDGDIIVENVTDKTAGKFTVSGNDSNHTLKTDGGNLVYTELYTVTFDANGGSGTMEDAVNISGTYSLPECLFTAPEGKKFKAWSINGTEYAPKDTVAISGNITAKALWADIEKTAVTVDETAQKFEYDSQAKAFAISANVTGSFTVKYQKNGSDIASPTDAGNYDVIIERAEDKTYKPYSKTVTGGLVITPKDITGATVGNFGKMTYTGSEHTPNAEVEIDGLTATGEWSKVTNVADTTTFTANGNFTGRIADKPTGMAKALSGIARVPMAKHGLKYDKKEQVLIAAGEADGGVIKYSIDNEATWSGELPKGINAGDYKVYFKVFGDENHEDTYANICNVSIAKAGVAIPIASGKVYTGNAQTSDINGNEYFTVSENNGGTEAGEYDVKLTLEDSTNYYWEGKDEDIAEITIGFNISSAENEWTVDPVITGWTYGGDANAPVYGAKFGEATVEYKKEGEKDSGYTAEVPTDAGAYNVRLTVAATKNFSGLTKVLDLSIAKADSSVTAPIAKENLVYNGTAQALTTNGSAEGGEIQYSTTENGIYTTDVITAVNAGNYEIWYKVAGDSNHNDIAPDKISASIAKAHQAPPEAPAALNETIKGKADGKITGVDSSMEYKADETDEYSAVTGEEIANLAAGKYLIRYRENDNYLAGSDKTVEISAGEMITVAFESNGGTAIEKKACEYNQTVTAQETEPAKEGYEFAGWFADGGLTTEWNFNTDRFTEDRTLYAKWVQGKISEDEGDVDEVTADGLNDIARAEKTDISLVVRVQETADDNESQTAIKGITGAPKNFGFYDIILEKSTGGTVEDAPSVIEIKLPYDFTRKKNIKVYRYHNENAQELAQLAERSTVKPFNDGTCFVDTKNKCIYIYSSRFSTYSVAYNKISSVSGDSGTLSYTVRFETNGANTVKTQTVVKNGVVTEPDEPKKDGYIFDGWYLSNDFAQAYNFGEKVTKNITLYAKWIENKEPADNKNKDTENDGKDKLNDADTHSCPSKEFSDLDINLWYHLDTDYVLSYGLMKGISPKTFVPDGILTRAMLVTLLYRNEGEPAVNNNNNPFTDVEKNSYYENAVLWAQQNGIVKGISETEFAPDDSIIREQIAAIMYRYAKFKGIDVSSGENTNILYYSDFDMVSKYAVSSVQWANGSDLIKGKSETTLNPKDNATRAEIAAVLHRFLKDN